MGVKTVIGTPLIDSQLHQTVGIGIPEGSTFGYLTERGGMMQWFTPNGYHALHRYLFGADAGNEIAEVIHIDHLLQFIRPLVPGIGHAGRPRLGGRDAVRG